MPNEMPTNDPRSIAALTANLSYWKKVADTYRTERDMTIREVSRLQRELLKRTGRAHDGLDYLREIKKTHQKAGLWQRIKNLFRGYL